jgi:hypothetical protein
MAATTSGFHGPPGSWQWPDDLPGTSPSERDDSSDRPHSDHTNSASQGHARSYQERARRPRHWPPRTCRICLETVLPTFHPPPANVPEFLQGAPSVTYESDDGRLIRPCRCKGSSKYVHESCLQAWRHADPAYGRRNFWQCPTCGFRYRLERMRWGHWISSAGQLKPSSCWLVGITLILLGAQLGLTLAIFLITTFMLGFIADPIINLYLDPYNTISPFSSDFDEAPLAEDEASWAEHFGKGVASLGLIGFVKVFFTLSPWQWWNLRSSGLMHGNARPGDTGRDRVASISWFVILVGLCTFLWVSCVLNTETEVLNPRRQCGKPYVHGADVSLKKRVNESWTYKKTTRMRILNNATVNVPLATGRGCLLRLTTASFHNHMSRQ